MGKRSVLSGLSLCSDLLSDLMDAFIGQGKSLFEIKVCDRKTDHGDDRHRHTETGLARGGNTKRPVDKLVSLGYLGAAADD